MITERGLLICTLLLAVIAYSSQTDAAQEEKHLFILSGQSNMREPLPSTFTQAVTKVFGKEKVIVATHGRPSQHIKMWCKSWTPPEGMKDPKPEANGTVYDELMNSVKRAINGSQLATVTFVWMQGEEDAREGWGAVYEKSFNAVLEQLKNDLRISKINFVLGRINDYWTEANGIKDGDAVRAAQVKIGESSANGAWINTDDLNTGVNPWGGYSESDGHFPPQGYRVMGLRFARKACLLIAPKMQLDESIFKESFFHSSEDVKTHAAIGKLISITPPDATHTDVKSGLASLLDGRYGTENANDPAWIGFQGNSNIQLVLDLGAPISIDSVAVNLLVSPQVSAFPKKIVFSTSEDGKTYRPADRHNAISLSPTPKSRPKTQEKPPKAQTVLVLAEQHEAIARYIKIEIMTAAEKLLLDEVIVNPQR